MPLELRSDTRLWDAEPGLLGPLEGRVRYVESLGRETLIAVETAADARFVVEAEGNVRAEPGEALRFGLRRGWVYLFDAGGSGIAQIALGCGFTELAHFSRRFKAAFGQSPSEFRARRDTNV